MTTNQQFADLLGITEQDGRLGVATGDAHTNASGGVHGGLIASLVDMAMGREVRAGLAEGQKAVTLQLAITYLNAAEPGDTLYVVADAGKRGTSIVMLTAHVTTGDGKDIAQGVGTFFVVDG